MKIFEVKTKDYPECEESFGFFVKEENAKKAKEKAISELCDETVEVIIVEIETED